MRLRNRFKLNLEIPTSSQSDIAFLLIIFFIITAIFFERTGIVFKLPLRDSKPITVSSREIIEIKLYNEKIIVNKKQIDFADLKETIKQLGTKKARNIIVIFFDKELSYGNFIKVFQELKKLKHLKVSIKPIGGDGAKLY